MTQTNDPLPAWAWVASGLLALIIGFAMNSGCSKQSPANTPENASDEPQAVNPVGSPETELVDREEPQAVNPVGSPETELVDRSDETPP